MRAEPSVLFFGNRTRYWSGSVACPSKSKPTLREAAHRQELEVLPHLVRQVGSEADGTVVEHARGDGDDHGVGLEATDLARHDHDPLLAGVDLAHLRVHAEDHAPVLELGAVGLGQRPQPARRHLVSPLQPSP